MPNAFSVKSEVRGGRLSESARRLLSTMLRVNEGKTLEIIIKQVKKKRSNNQNAFYWGVCIPMILEMFRDAGNNVDSAQVHEFLKAEVGKLNQSVILPDGEIKQVAGSTAVMNTMEFEDYLTKIRVWAAEYNLTIPLPNENNCGI